MEGSDGHEFRRKGRTQSDPNPFQRAGKHIQGKVGSGLLELLPTLVTIVVITFIIIKTDEFVENLPFVEGQPWDVPGIGIVSIVVVSYLAGLLISTGFGRRVMGWKDEVLSHIPVVKGVFGVTRQATTALTSQFNFSRVVFLEWPREGMIAMGFVTARVQAPGREEGLVIVYIPTIPNPTSGNMALVAEDDVLETDLSVEDAMKLVFSGGIVPPKAMSLARVPKGPRDESEFIGRFETDRN